MEQTPKFSTPLGFDTLRNQNISLEYPRDISQHVTLLGVTGSGKTTTAVALMGGAAAAGMSIVIVDAKGGGLRNIALGLSKQTNLPYREVVPGIAKSYGYNPCRLGSRSQVADKIVSSFTHGGASDIYRLIGQEAIAILTGVLRTLGQEVSIRTLRSELNRYRMPALAKQVAELDTSMAEDLLDLSKRGRVAYDALDGMRSRLGALLHGAYGEIFDNVEQQLDLVESLNQPGVTYISLPALAVSADTALMARVLIQDLKQVAYERLQDENTRPALLILDEFAALDDPDQINDLLRQAREAKICTVVSTQHLPDALSAYGLRMSLLGAGALIAHRTVAEDAETVAQTIGTEKANEVTRSFEQGANNGSGSVRRVDHFIIQPNDIKQLSTGEAVVLLNVGSRRVQRIIVQPPQEEPYGDKAS